MTIGIGVLCSTTGKGSDALVLISDSMGSTETDSTSALSKMFTHGSIHAVAAGSLSVAAEMFHTIAGELGPVNTISFSNEICSGDRPIGYSAPRVAFWCARMPANWAAAELSCGSGGPPYYLRHTYN
jgi:hypothetical protein